MREVKIKTSLQQRITEHNSLRSFISKKSVSYLPEKAYALCVHNTSMPFLEMYATESDIANHLPQKVMDLFDCSFVSKTLEDDRTFIIGFEDPSRSALELTALTPNDCDNWVTVLTAELPDLHCLPAQDNVYVSLPCSSRQDETGFLTIVDSCADGTFQSMEDADLSVNRESFDRIEHQLMVSPQSSCPPLPPRSLGHSLSSSQAADSGSEGFYTLLGHCCNVRGGGERISDDLRNKVEPLLPNMDYTALNRDVGHIVDNEQSFTSQQDLLQNFSESLRKSTFYANGTSADNSSGEFASGTGMPNGYSEVRRSRPVQKSDLVATQISSIMRTVDLPQALNDNNAFINSSAGIKTRTNATSDPLLSDRAPPLPLRDVASSCNKDQMRSNLATVNSTKRTSVKEQEILKLKRHIESKAPLKIVVNAEAAVRGLALVELNFGIWVAGWSLAYNKSLSAAFYVGDEVVAIDGRQVCPKLDDVKRLLDSLAFTGNIEITIKRLPFADAFCFKRSYEGQNLGLMTKKGTNEIMYVDGNGVAALCGFPPKAPSRTDAASEINWFLTEINGRPLSMFAASNEAFNRLNAVGHELTVVVQPVDFIKLLRKALKHQKKNYKDFSIAC